jgi:hypothetical protein
MGTSKQCHEVVSQTIETNRLRQGLLVFFYVWGDECGL